MKDLHITQSQDIYDYKPILQGLVYDFDLEYYQDILTWCGVMDNNDPDYFWQVFLIKEDNEVVGICGLYSLYPLSTEELWLGWFGVVPEKRNQGIGQYALTRLKEIAEYFDCKKLMSYVGEDGGPMGFYLRNGFKHMGTVKEYLTVHPELTLDSFGNEDYLIIECNL